METKLGVFMDHSVAHLMTFNDKVLATTIIQNDFDHEVLEEALVRSENIMHNKRQQRLAAYYKKIENAISNHKHVLLFGPTDAKTELHNILMADAQLKKIQVEVRSSDKLTENQKHAFIKAHFSS